MNKKGFTLVELLATITIIGIIATVVSINFLKNIEIENIKKSKNENNIIASAACVYIELEENSYLKETCLNNGCDITTSELIKSGLLYKDDVNNSKVIHIYKESNEKKCIIKE